MDCVRARGSVPGCERQQWGGDDHYNNDDDDRDKDDDDPVLSCRDDHFLGDDRDDQEVVYRAAGTLPTRPPESDR